MRAANLLVFFTGATFTLVGSVVADVAEEVDRLAAQVGKSDGGEVVVTVDHRRLAEAEGVPMPPSILTLISDPAVNTAILKDNLRAGLDLPAKVLCYSEPGAEVASVAFDGPAFLQARHGLTDAESLKSYDEQLQKLIGEIPAGILSPVKSEGVAENLAVVELKSPYSVSESCGRIKKAVMSQGDTKWFGEVDFTADAKALGEELPEAMLLLFGGPKPGGVAMANHPKLGLDAFCQKLLVYESEDGVRVIFNDIAALSEWHYGNSIDPQKMINGRLKQTFEAALKPEA